MRLLLLIGSVVFVCCKQPSSETGADIISRSIVAHGGWEAYSALDSINIDKTIRLFDPHGNLESESIERQSFVLSPTYQTTLVKAMDSTVYDSKVVHLYSYHGDSITLDENKQRKEIKRIKAAEFVFFQPFKLRDSTATMTKGKSRRINSVDVSEVQVNYPNSKDIWWFYFDGANRCVANKVKHNERYSLIENLEFQTYKGLLLHKHRKSYFVDSLGTKDYLRAEYFYEIIR